MNTEKWQSMTATMNGGNLQQAMEPDAFLDEAGQFMVAQGSRHSLVLFLTKDEAAQWAGVLTEWAEQCPPSPGVTSTMQTKGRKCVAVGVKP